MMTEGAAPKEFWANLNSILKNFNLKFFILATRKELGAEEGILLLKMQG